MKLLLAATLVATLSAAAPPATVLVVPQPVDDPPPVECPLCGGNVRMHFLIVSALTATQAEAGWRLLDAVF